MVCLRQTRIGTGEEGIITITTKVEILKRLDGVGVEGMMSENCGMGMGMYKSKTKDGIHLVSVTCYVQIERQQCRETLSEYLT